MKLNNQQIDPDLDQYIVEVHVLDIRLPKISFSHANTVKRQMVNA
jgi:hypothetical protein